MTLLELLVVIAILGILLGILLPAVQKVREATARLKCLNNLKQLGLALHLCHDATEAFPSGCSFHKGADPTPHMGWMTRLLPFLEQDHLWRQSLSAFSQARFFLEPPHDGVRAHVLSLFICPSDGRAAAPGNPGPFAVAFTSYQGVTGQDRKWNDGILFLDSQVRLTDVQDGTSNTLVIGERPHSADMTLGWWYAGWGQAMDGSLDLHLGVRETNVYPRYGACGPGPFAYRPGSLTSACSALHFWSLHPGGANFAFADGSVRFLSYDANTVMPALASRAGGEPITAP
ncbi:MAG: DUF1559 domain-containing protein [Gemmataceae bacterium]